MKPKTKQTNRTFKSLKAAAAGLNLPVQCLRWAANQGCPAIRANGSVNEAEFLEWWGANGKGYKAKDELTTLKIKKLSEEWRRLKLENDETEGALISKQLVSELMSKYHSDAKSVLRQELENTLPAECAGQDIETIRGKMTATVDKICDSFATLADVWPKETE